MLCLYATPGVSRPALEAIAPIKAAGIRTHLIPIPGLSAVFTTEAARLRSPSTGRLAPALLRKYAPGASPDEPILLAGFSAGVWMWREGLSEHPDDRAQVAGVIAIDGLHATEHQLATTRKYLDEGGRMLVIHSDTPTYGYPSTTETVRTLGPHEGLVVRHSPGGHDFRTLRADVHIREWLQSVGPRGVEVDPEQTLQLDAPRTWPGATGAAVEAWQRRVQAAGYYDGPIDGQHGPQTESGSQLLMDDLYAPPPGSLAERLCHALGYQYGIDPREIPGPQHNKLILRYSEHCRRGGTFLGVDAAGTPIWDGGTPLRAPSDEWAWCMIAQSAALQRTLRPGERPPHGLRVAVREGVEDARAAGTIHVAKAGVCVDGYQPKPGDAVVSSRIPGESPLRGGRGHIEGLITMHDDGTMTTIGGNESNRWIAEVESIAKVEAYIER